MRLGILVGLLLVATSTAVAAEPIQRTLTFEDRVIAQQRIDAVYASALTGPPIGPIAARALAEAKVRETLKKSILLATYWKTPITRDALHREIERIARSTGMPDRLRALYVALGNDSFLIEEALARPVLVDRLIGNFFAYDESIHAQVRAEAEFLRAEIIARSPMPDLGSASRMENELKRSDNKLDDVAFERALRGLPVSTGVPGELREERTAFTFDVVSDRAPDFVRFESYSVPKLEWQTWWENASATIDDAAVLAEANSPSPGVSAGLAPVLSVHDCNPGGAWDNGLLGLLPDPRWNHSAVWTGAEMIVWGGDVAQNLRSVNSGGRYDPLTDTWRKMSVSGAPSPRENHQAIWTGQEMIVWGGAYVTRVAGSAPVSVLLNDGGRYNPSTDTWTPTSGVGTPPAGSNYSAVWTGARMVVWNGTSGGRYNPSTNTWSPVSTLGAPPAGMAVWTGAKMIVWGGAAGAQYDPAADTWTAMSAVGAPSHASPPLLWTGSEVIAWDWAGTGAGALYNPTTNSWRAMSPGFGSDGPPVWTGTEMAFSGGAYDPATNTWTHVADSNLAIGTTVVWSGQYMIFWGGLNGGGGAVNRGERYDPASGVWTLTSTNDAPSGDVALGTPIGMLFWSGGIYDVTLDAWRTFNAPLSGQAVSTGREVIWWNGSSGGRLDLATLNWTPISTTGAPSAGAAVWTGSLMVVWSGSTGGGRYNPANNTWTPMASSGAPSVGGLAVWARSVMTVWNGSSRTGARYDPVTNTWTPMSSTGAPSARNGSTAIGTANSMVVWGGRIVGGGKTNDGGRYNPMTDTWLPTSLTNAPSPREFFASVWTGREMVVWGGAIGDATTNTGGLYDPLTDSWVAVTQDGAPVERYGHTLVWTGEAVLVWGGIIDQFNNFSPLNTGGRLFLGQLHDDDGDGYSECQNDCNDANPNVHPGAAEVCNGIDDNCDGQIDEDATGVDSDGDGIHNACDNCRFVANATQTDSDGDHVGNACDNCINLSNPNQADTDGDGRGDACDNCPMIPNGFQDDSDADRVGDACDNCPLDYNPTQSDFNHDGIGDICDLHDGLIYIYSTDTNYREWQSEAGYTTWNSYRGSLSVLRATGKFTQAPGSNSLAARACGVSDPYVFDADIPAPGDVAFNLVTGVAGGVESSLGSNSAGVPRANANPCP